MFKKLAVGAGAGVGAVGLLVCAALGTVAPAFASFDYANTFAGASTEALAALGAVIPIAIGVFAVILGIRVGQRLFKQFAK
jgi:hypothetical protein